VSVTVFRSRKVSVLARRSPQTALSLIACLLGLVGTPPTAVFVGKLLVIGAALDGGYGWLAVIAAINTVASLFYYLRWIVPLFSRTPSEIALARAASGIAHAAAAASIALGMGSGLVLTI
jgi:NADH-quinone oxidoreductase subunit N